MRLISTKYFEFENTPKAWHLDEFIAGPINLLVGKNAAGKTRTISLIFALANLVCGDIRFTFINGSYEMHFINNEDLIDYYLRYEDGHIKVEKFILNGKVLLDRQQDGIGSIYAEEVGTEIKFQVPDNQLACVLKRDDIQHPFFKPLYEWGKSTLLYNFGTPLGKDAIVPSSMSENLEQMLNLKDTNNVVMIYKKGVTKFGPDYTASIISSMHDIGYEIESIGTAVNPNLRYIGPPIPINVSNPVCLFVKEKDLGERIYQTDVSQGMFRCLSLFIQVYYAQMSSTPHLLIIDDIGEGLDFERSTALITILIGIAKKSDIQLIMSSNDRFVMNSVPLMYWSIIQRTGGHCKVYSKHNSKKFFDEFEFTGLSNFDFLSTDFTSQDMSEK
jgi:hypothetical protein